MGNQDLDELDRELEEYNRSVTNAKLRAPEKDGGYDVSRHTFQMEAMKLSLQKLMVQAEGFEKDVKLIDKRKSEDQIDLILKLLFFLAGMGIALFFGWLALTMGIGGAVSFGFLCLTGGIMAIIGGLASANSLTSYLAKLKAGPHSPLVEMNYLRSYAGEREYLFDCIGEVHKRAGEIRRTIEKIEQKGYISDEALEKAKRIGQYTAPPSIYKTEKLKFSEWFHFKATLRKK